MGARGGFTGGALGGTVTGGCARGQALYLGREGPADEGSAGPFRDECYSVGSSGLGAGKGSGSNSSHPTGIVNTLPSATVIFRY